MTSRKTTSADTAQCSTTSHDAATDALAMSQSDVAVLAETFRLLGDQSRLKILLQCMHGSVCSGQEKLATVLCSNQNNRSDSFGVRPPL